MADRPLPNPLPADLPENWTSGQIVAPAGADAGLSEQHGYNYLMEQVNAAQRAANAINESFDTISGKRTCRITVGTSGAGWTQADCDYLCDGTNDETVLTTAISAIHAVGGGEIAILAGQYNLPNGLNISDAGSRLNLSITGEPGATVLELGGGIFFSGTQAALSCVRFSGLTFHHDNPGVGNTAGLGISQMSAVVEGCALRDAGLSWAGGERQKFAFRGNEVDATYLENNFFSATAYSIQNSVVIAGNTFRAAGNQAAEKWTFIHLDVEGPLPSAETEAFQQAGAVFAGNAVICAAEAVEPMVRVEPSGVVASNAFAGASIYVRFRVACVGNRVEGGRIVASGDGQVTGNIVAAPAGSSAIDVRENEYSSVPHVDETPNITGNIITSGDVGVHLDVVEDQSGNTNRRKAIVSSNRISGCTTSIQIEKNWSGCLVTGNMIDTAVVDHGSGNLVRLNSDDAGGGGGGTAGVASFNGRSGTVVPLTGDYTAIMVGARADTWTPTAADVGAVPAGDVTSIQAMTQAEYDALATKDPATLYLIKE